MILFVLILLLLLFIYLYLNYYRVYYFNLKKLFRSKISPRKIGKYYDKWKNEYCKYYGEVLQAHRSENVEEMLDYIIKSAGIEEGYKILDAGCGYCGPAIFFANKVKNIKIEAITISKEQYEYGLQAIKNKKVEGNINLRLGDYHKLVSLYPLQSFDLVYFLESYGHATNQTKVLKQAVEMLKPGGKLYIKDYFMAENFNGILNKYRMRKSISNLNKVYRYNLPDIYHTIYVLRKAGMELVFIKKPSFNWNKGITVIDFQKNNNINLFDGIKVVKNVEVFELLFKKP